MRRPWVAFALLAAAAGLAALLAAGPEPAEEGAPPADGTGGAPPAEARTPALLGREEPAIAPGPDRSRLLVGAVLDPEGAPVRGAAVTAEPTGPARAERRALAREETGEDGSFAFRVPVPEGARSVTVRLEAVEGDRAASREVAVPWPADEGARGPLEVGFLVLRESVSLVVQVEETAGPGTATAWLVALEEGGSRTPRPIPLDPRGRGEVDRLPAGDYRAVAVGESRGRAVAPVRLPRREEGPLRLVLGSERIVVVSVVDLDTGRGIPGAVVEACDELSAADLREGRPALLGAAISPTGPDGTTRLRGLASDTELQIRATAPGYPRPRREPAWVKVPARATEARLALRAARTVRWRMEAEGAVAPREGARVLLHTPEGADDLPAVAEVLEGGLVSAGWPAGPASGTAVAPDGAIAVFVVPPTGGIGRPVTFRRPTRADVRLLTPSGAPLAGWTVGAAAWAGHPPVATARTDERGVATLEGLPAGPGASATATTIAPRGLGEASRRLVLKALDLSRGDVRFDVTVPDPSGVEVRVRLDGRAGLPASRVPTTLRLGGEAVRGVARDEEAGVLRTTWRPGPLDEGLAVTLEAAGYVAGDDGLRFPPGRAKDPLRFQVDLWRWGSATVEVRLPADRVHGVQLARSHDRGATWRPAGEADLAGASAEPRTTDAGEVVYVRLKPGLYRAVDATTGAVSDPFWVEGGERGRTVLDLSRAGWIRGVVLDADGLPAPRAEVVLHRDGPGAATAGAPGPREKRLAADGEGRFTVRVPDDARVRLVPRASGRSPDPPEGVLVRGPQDGVVLRLR